MTTPTGPDLTDAPSSVGAAWPRSRRQGAALGYLLAVGLAASGPLLSAPLGPVLTAVGAVAAIGLFVLLRRAGRMVATGASGPVDDLVQRLRGQCFQMAYNVLAAVSAVIGAVLLIAGASGATAAVFGLLLLGLALGLPVLLLALTLPDAER
jgi:hypothetical protein